MSGTAPAAARSGLRAGVGYALACLGLLGLMPVIANGRPPGSGAVTFAWYLTLWEVLVAVPVQLREWRSGERGLLGDDLTAAVRRRVVVTTLVTSLLFALSTWGYVLALEKVGTVNAAIALQVYPLVAAGYEAVVTGRRRSAAELAATVVVVAALFYLTTGGTWRMSGLSPWFLVALGVPVLWTVAHVALRQALVSTSITPVQVTTSRLLLAAVMLAPLALVVDGASAVLEVGTDPRQQLFAAVMGVTYYLELVFWFHAVRHVDVSVGSAITVPAPAVTLLLAAVMLGEPVHAYQVAALVVVVAGLVTFLLAGARRARTAGAAAPGPPAASGGQPAR